MDEKKTNKIRTVRDLKVYRKAIDRLDDNYEHISAMLNSMEKKADTFCHPSS